MFSYILPYIANDICHMFLRSGFRISVSLFWHFFASSVLDWPVLSVCASVSIKFYCSWPDVLPPKPVHIYVIDISVLAGSRQYKCVNAIICEHTVPNFHHYTTKCSSIIWRCPKQNVIGFPNMHFRYKQKSAPKYINFCTLKKQFILEMFLIDYILTKN